MLRPHNKKQDSILVYGFVKEATKEAAPIVGVRVFSGCIGTRTNAQGYYELKYSFVPNSLSETFFTSSFLGYRSIETKRLKMSMDK